MQRSLRSLAAAAIAALLPLPLLAQLTVQGRVTDDTSRPLLGAFVTVEGTAISTATDEAGAYRIVIPRPAEQTVLVVRYVGHKQGRAVVTRTSGIVEQDFSLGRDVLLLDQMVVTATRAATERSTLGAALSAVNGEDLNRAGALQIDAALAGKVPGALVQQASGTPGGGTSVRIRGTSTISRSAEPLYIVDGVIVDNSSSELINLGGYSSNRLADLDPNDIERVEIVKGAAAAALYGSRANDGVVQIFTKRGRPGQTRFTLTSSMAVDELERRIETNRSPVNAKGETVQRWDYQDDLFRTAPTYSTALSASGGDERTRFYISGSFQDQDGILRGTDYRKENVRVNLDQELTSWLKVATHANYIHSKAHILPNAGLVGLTGVLTNFFFTPTDYNLHPDPESGQYPKGYLFANPLEAIANWKAPQEVDRFVGGLQLSAYPLPGLSIDYRFGYDAYTQSAQEYIPRDNSAPSLATGLAISATQRARLFNSDLDVSHRYDASPRLRFTTGLGVNYQQQNYDVVTARAEDLALLTSTVRGSKQFSDQRLDERRTLGFFAQETFAFDDRLFLTAALRSDASSAFGADERQQYFPKASGSFELSRSAFWQDLVGTTVNRLRLRAAYGQSGGQPAGSFERFSNYVFELSGTRSGIVNATQRGNEQLKPERMAEVELGFDAEFLDGRLGLEFTYYDQQVTELILPRTLNPSSGFTQQLANVGELENKGMEVLLRSFNVRRPSWNWTTSVSVTTNDPLVNKLSDGGAFFIPESFGIIRVEAGEAPGHYYGTTYVRDAQGRILDKNGSPIQDASGKYVGIPAIGPRKIIGDPNPDAFWSVANEFEFGQNLGVRLQFDGVTGGDLFNFDRRLLDSPPYAPGRDYDMELGGEVPKGFFQARRSIFEEYIEDGDWVKLRELAIGYTVRPAVVQRLGVRGLRLNVAGRNLKTWSDYRAWDPETNAGGQRTLVRGFGFATVPLPRSVVFGVTANF